LIAVDRIFTAISMAYGCHRTLSEDEMVPLAGIEPALLAESDFESDASTNSATGASGKPMDVVA
jgi:hypothetical protein